MHSHAPHLVLLTVLCAVLALSACGTKGQEGDAATKEGGKSAKRLATHQIAVETLRVSRATFAQRLTLSGQFAAVRTAHVSVEIPGRVIDLRAKEGGHVESGAVLVRQDSTVMRAQLAQADAAVAQTNAAIALARNQLNRAEKMARSKVLDRARLDAARLGYKQAKAARGVALAGRKLVRANLAKLIVKSPLSGTVVRRTIEIGEVANPGAPLFTLADFSTVKLLVDVPERHIARVQLGEKIALTVAALHDRPFTGLVTRVPMLADARNRTYAVEIEVSNADGDLRGGMTARVGLLLDQKADQVVVPLDAVIDEPTATLSKITSVVFVVKDGKAHRIIVQTGLMQEGTVLIAAGLRGGEELIVVGQRRVVDGDFVRVIRTNGGPAKAILGQHEDAAKTAEMPADRAAPVKKTL